MKEAGGFIQNFIENLKSAREFLPQAKREFENRGSRPELSIRSLPVFNRKIWGLRAGLTILGARTSNGKSSLALQIGFDIANQGQPVWFVSLEMSVESLIERLFCNIMMIDNYDILTGRIEEHREQWQEFEKRLEIPLWLSCGIGRDFSELNESVELLEPKPKVIIIDFIQAIRNFGDERQNLNEYIRKFRQLCVENRIAGVLCSQVSRKVFEEGQREPTLYNLKGTGNLEEASDTCLLLHWQHFYDNTADENEFKIIVAKQRNGRTGEHKLHFEPKYYRFSDIAIEEANQHFQAKEHGLFT